MMSENASLRAPGFVLVLQLRRVVGDAVRQLVADDVERPRQIVEVPPSPSP